MSAFVYFAKPEQIFNNRVRRSDLQHKDPSEFHPLEVFGIMKCMKNASKQHHFLLRNDYDSLVNSSKTCRGLAECVVFQESEVIEWPMPGGLSRYTLPMTCGLVQCFWKIEVLECPRELEKEDLFFSFGGCFQNFLYRLNIKTGNLEFQGSPLIAQNQLCAGYERYFEPPTAITFGQGMLDNKQVLRIRMTRTSANFIPCQSPDSEGYVPLMLSY